MYEADKNRYLAMEYNRCGKSGLVLPKVSLGLWHNFGSIDNFDNAQAMILRAFDLGIIHFDIANNYGPRPGSAEENFGKIYSENLQKYRDEIIVSSKAGYPMWDGPYGDWGSRKSLIASCDQSLKRTKLEYFDIFYHHRPDPGTPIEESMLALDQIVRSGKALYVGISNYDTEGALQAFSILNELKTPGVIYQGSFNMLNRKQESSGMLELLQKLGKGMICFSPLAQGLLSSKYLKGIPDNSRASRNQFLKIDSITPDLLEKISKLNALAKRRNQSLSQMAISWVLSRNGVTSALFGASSCEQIEEIALAAKRSSFSDDEYEEIDSVIFSKFKYSR
ncbi:MAG: aldo/keto reductase [Lentisphaeria bacterium]|nr:aldo/keto reductase [Lentisphaeria bacterium]